MVERALALLMALAVAGAPVAMEACRITCAATAPASASRHATQARVQHDHATAAHTACHEVPTTPQLSQQAAHPCDHNGEASAPTIDAGRHADGAWFAAVAVPTTTSLASGSKPTLLPQRQWAPPDRIAIELARPLRI